MRKPAPEIYALGAERIGLAARGVRVRRRPAVQPDAGGGARDGDRSPHRRGRTRSPSSSGCSACRAEVSPRARGKTARTVAAALTALAAAACGSSSVSASQLSSQATSICARANRQIERIPTPSSAAGALAFLNSGIAALEPELAQLRQLQASGDAADVWRTAVRALSDQLSALQSTASQIKGGADPSPPPSRFSGRWPRSRARPTAPGKRFRSRPARTSRRRSGPAGSPTGPHQRSGSALGPRGPGRPAGRRRRDQDLDVLGAGEMHAVGATAGHRALVVLAHDSPVDGGATGDEHLAGERLAVEAGGREGQALRGLKIERPAEPLRP